MASKLSENMSKLIHRVGQEREGEERLGYGSFLSLSMGEGNRATTSRPCGAKRVLEDQEEGSRWPSVASNETHGGREAETASQNIGE